MDIERLPAPLHIAAREHGIKPQDISPAAREVISTLQKAGFQAYIVGGSVRDLLLGHHPKDFDVATDALPEEVKSLFKRCFLIGRRFRLAHVHINHHVIEVATFRGNTPPEEPETNEQGEKLNPKDQAHHTHQTTGLVLRDNVYGSFAEDAWRRDFSVNALYYDPKSGDVIDFTDGYADLKKHHLRIIGNAQQRYREDPVRMLRAIRFMGKLNFELDKESAATIKELAHLLAHIPSARLFDEFNKLFMYGHALLNYELLNEYSLFSVLMPQTMHALNDEHIDNESMQNLIKNSLRNTDQRIKQNKPVTPAFLFAAFLWPVYTLSVYNYQKHHHQSPYFASISAANEVLGHQAQQVSLPKRLSVFIREMWQLQPRLVYLRKRHIGRTLRHPRFRAAYDFLHLRVEAGEPYEAIAKWWTAVQAANDEKRAELFAHLPAVPKEKTKEKKE